ncbi:MAG: hypothetical protein M3281_01495 [Chloroflexota bacterium]|nr:hypothetical protein [Chloroflexota bacterium]
MALGTEVQWRGTDEEQRVARTVFDLLMLRARFFSESAPIRQPLSGLVQFFESQPSLTAGLTDGDLTGLIRRSLETNNHVFGHEEQEGETVFVTTRTGTPPPPTETAPNLHTFKSRLYEGAREPTEEDLKAVRGVAREVPDFVISTPDFATPFIPEDLTSSAYRFEPEEDELDLTPEGVLVEPEAEAEPEEVAEPAATVLLRLGDTVMDPADGAELIIAEHGNRFRELLGTYLDQDFRFVRFGDEYYIEDRVERLSKGQLRDIREYIVERGEPLTDEELLSDALSRPLQDADYNLWRFTINFRLSRERKDFRFVGTRDDRLWATSSLPPVGQSYRKPSEIAQDYRYLTDLDLSDQDLVMPASGEEASGRLELRHTLTWYETENGVLPVGRGAQLLMPSPLLEDQQVVMLRIQDPQNFATYMVELRLGGGNRGTYIAGLEELFQNTLVPGAVFSLVQGAQSNEFTVEYDRQTAREARLLQWDGRRERWFFAPVVFECPVDNGYLLTEDKVGQLNGEKRASDGDRRRPEVLLARAFELVGEPSGGSLTALLDDLLPAINIERPFSRQYLESLIESAQYPQFGFEDESLGLAYYRR